MPRKIPENQKWMIGLSHSKIKQICLENLKIKDPELYNTYKTVEEKSNNLIIEKSCRDCKKIKPMKEYVKYADYSYVICRDCLKNNREKHKIQKNA